MINKYSPLKDLQFLIPIIIPIKGRGYINHGSGLVGGLGFRASGPQALGADVGCMSYI